MERSFREQVQRFANNDVVRIAATVGVAKALEVVVFHFVHVWFVRVAALLGLALGVLWVAAWSQSIDL